MPSYNPSCNNCHRCPTCRGNGWIEQTRNVDPKRFAVIKERVTCPLCKGVGGTVGPGPHNHK